MALDVSSMLHQSMSQDRDISIKPCITCLQAFGRVHMYIGGAAHPGERRSALAGDGGVEDRIGANLSDFLLHIFSLSLLFCGVRCVRARKHSCALHATSR